MRISPEGLASLSLAGLLAVAACVPDGRLGTSKVSGSVIPLPTRIIPEECQIGPAENFRPPSLRREWVATFPTATLVNLASGQIDLRVNPLGLHGLNTDPEIGLNLQPGDNLITYFVPQRLTDDVREKVEELMLSQKAYLILRHCQEQGSKGRVYSNVISVAGELDDLVRKNPRASYTDTFYNAGLGTQLSITYVSAGLAAISGQSVPRSLTPRLREAVVKETPFVVARIDHNFLKSLELAS